jgi:hypothetical protein
MKALIKSGDTYKIVFFAGAHALLGRLCSGLGVHLCCSGGVLQSAATTSYRWPRGLQLTLMSRTQVHTRHAALLSLGMPCLTTMCCCHGP